MTSTTLAITFFQKLLQWLDNFDKNLFVKINTQWTFPLLDQIFPWYRDATTWYPLYLFLLLFILINYKQRGVLWIGVFILTISISDQLSSSILKNYFARPRPCSNSNFIQQVRLLLDACPVNFSFTSSHATNHFAAAMFIFLTLKRDFKKWSYLFFIWAITICYAQVYVGVHYPLDVLGGALVGTLIGFAFANFFNRRIGLLHNVQTTKETN